MSSSKFSSIDDYLASLDSTKAETLRNILNFVLAEFPDARAKIAWNVPHIERDGKYLMGLAAYKNHLTVSPWSAFVMTDFTPRLHGYKIFKNCFQIPVDWEMDADLIRDLVRARLAELG